MKDLPVYGIKDYFGSLAPSAVTFFVAPFALLLVCLAVFPLIAPHFWEKNRNKALVSAVFGAPVTAFLVMKDWHLCAATALDYLAFIAFIGSLFVISGGIYIRGAFTGRPAVNAAFLFAGALFANIIGTVGASVLFIRPVLRANHSRRHKAHIVIFFIFIVSNCAGLLTPLGDPPLFLGFLKGVEFFWTLRLWPMWAFTVLSLTFLFYCVDTYWYGKEGAPGRGTAGQRERPPERFGVEGRRNFICLGAVIAVILASGYLVAPMEGPAICGEPFGMAASKLVQLAGMACIALVSFRATAPSTHRKNQFSFAPLFEVVAIFLGVFATMPPALLILETQGHKLGVSHPWQFFWMTGLLSSFLDNAPTYLTFTSLAKGALLLPGEGLKALMHHPLGARYLAAISCGAVMMGANTYIGNGPNFMVKAIAEHHKVKMPSFFRYMLWSLCILIPLFIAVSVIFF